MSTNDKNQGLTDLMMLAGGLCGLLALSVSCLAAQAALFQAESETLIGLFFTLVGGLILWVLSIPGIIYLAVVMTVSESTQPALMVKEEASVLMGHAIPLWIITFFCFVTPFLPRIINGLINLWLVLSPVVWLKKWRSKWESDETTRKQKKAAYEKNVADLERAKAELDELRSRRK